MIKELEQYKGFTDEFHANLSENLFNQVEDEIKKRIIALGVDINDHDYIKRNFEFIEKEGDEFKHLFYKPENKFVVSIQKVPTIDFKYDTGDLSNNKITCTASYKYY